MHCVLPFTYITSFSHIHTAFVDEDTEIKTDYVAITTS